MSHDPDPSINRQVVLRQRPQGLLTADDVEIVERPMPTCGDGQIKVQMLYFQMDAAVRSWLDEGAGYLPAVEIGEPVRSGGLGRVIESNHPDVEVGIWTGAGLPGWQEYVVAEVDDPLVQLFPASTEPLFHMAVIASAGPTAYFGLTDLGELSAGETVLVSAAAGSTGSMAVQIARNLGARVIGIAGSDQKCRWVESIGADVCINRRSEDINARLREVAPKGIDVYFDNVGGDILDIALRRLALHGRVVVCGAISMYNASGRPPGPSNYLNLISRQGKMVGLQGLSYLPRYPEAHEKLYQWRDEGRLDFRVDVANGLESCVGQLNALFTGANTGKALVQIAEDPFA